MTKQNLPIHQQQKAISYLRYSTKKQAIGGSEARQLEWAEQYCSDNDLLLVDSYKDLGISAHRGKHSKEGKLADLIKDCQSGKIPKGYALIVENFDRLSREEVPVALQRFLTLINDYELEIHTLDDKRVYSPGKIDLTELIISIVIMGRAHSESARKSVLVSKAWKRTRDLGKAHSKPGKNPLGCFPKWLDWDSEKQVWLEKVEAVATIKYIFELVIDTGIGRYQIAQRLNHEEVPVISNRAKIWSAPMVKDITNNRSLLGEWIPQRTNDKDAKVVLNYYPQVVDPETYERSQQVQRLRNHDLGGRPVKVTRQYSILTGIGRYLGGRLAKGYYKRKKGGEIIDTYSAQIGSQRKYLGWANQLEHFVCALISELDSEELAANTSHKHLEGKLKSQLKSKMAKLTELQKTKDNWVAAIGVSGGDIPELVKKVKESNYDIEMVKSKIADLNYKLNDVVTSSGVHSREEVSLLRDKALNEKDLQSRQDLQVALGQLITSLDVGKIPEDLPLNEPGFTEQALILQSISPIKYWARIRLFNDSIVLGAMTADGEIARIRWDSE